MNTGCSFRDNICFLTAKKKSLICATNDKQLRKVCKENGVETLWGLQIMLYLVQEDKLKKKEAIKIAWNINKINSNITKELVEEFESKVNSK